MKRWRQFPEEMVEDHDGPYVRYDDHLAAVEQARREERHALKLTLTHALAVNGGDEAKALADFLNVLREQARAEGKP